MAPNWRRKSSGGSQNSWTSQRLEAGIEKGHLHDRESDWEDDDDDTPSYGSRVTSGSSEPMLGKASTAYSQPKKSSFFITRLRLPAGSVSRWLCFGLTALMFGFIFTLFHASWASARRVEHELQNGGSATKRPPQWLSFAPNLRLYGGLQSIVPKSQNVPEFPLEYADGANETRATEDTVTSTTKTKIFNPYPNYKSEEYIARYGEKVDCFLDAAGEITVPSIHMHEGVPKGMPEPAMGSAQLLGLRDDVCYDRLGRLGPYGLGYSLPRGGSGASLNGDRSGAEEVWSEVPEVDWKNVNWAKVQERCVRANNHRFKPLPEPKIERMHNMPIGEKQMLSKRAETEPTLAKSENAAAEKSVSKKLPRTAVIIRTWNDFQYTTESVIYLRSLISELALHSGGEYHVHFLVHVKDNNIPIWSDDWMYERMINESLPEEFRGMGTLWSERQMHLAYGDLQESMMRGLPVHGVYRSTFMPLQYFAYNHPEYDFFWHWEMDARYTGHYYHLFESLGKWAKEQPRKNLWERNSRFYVPSEHGSWEEFSHMVRVQTEQGTNSPNNMWSSLNKGAPTTQASQPTGDKPVWGPEPPLDDDVALFTDATPPTTYKEDKNNWGVGEEADLITLNPLFDPEGTSWLLAEDVTGYNRTRGFPPRRVAIITASRLSRRLLNTMHHETAMLRHTMFSEMWPASCALHHGLKAVYAPHPVFVDRQWPTKVLASTFNGGKDGATGGARTSVFGEREHNFGGTTWYYNAGLPAKLWHRWLGYKFENEGGEEWEINGEGRMCLPGMLLHPVKEVKLVQEGRTWDDGQWTGGGWHEP